MYKFIKQINKSFIKQHEGFIAHSRFSYSNLFKNNFSVLNKLNNKSTMKTFSFTPRFFFSNLNLHIEEVIC